MCADPSLPVREQRHGVAIVVRRWLLPLLPFVFFAAIYSSMNLLPNYKVRPVDIEGVHAAELQWFGIGEETPSEYCYARHTAFLDVLSGCFYLLWVPLPVFFCLWLCWEGEPRHALRFSSAFLVVNLVGFLGYYIHPSAPPWYYMFFGTDFIASTPGNMAGFARFDALTGLPLFASIYEKNANVFAAIPSLHVAYNLVAAYYAWLFGHRRVWLPLLLVVSAGISFSAVYSAHHYVIDVLLGWLTALVGILLFEGMGRLICRINLKRR